MRITDLPDLCTRHIAKTGCKDCEAREICTNLTKVASICSEIGNWMPMYWDANYKLKKGAVELDQLLRKLGDVQRVGRWIALEDGSLKCDNRTCDYETMSPTMYCPCCGNKMEV